MENIVFKFTDAHQHGPAFSEFLRLRKQWFVDQLNWGVPHNNDFEMDQYDNPQAYYSLVLQDGKVIAGARFMPTTSRWGSHTYMLRDAVRGKLIDIPESVLDDEIETPEVWEGTRMVVADDIQDHSERSRCLFLIIEGIDVVLKQNGGKHIVSLSPVPFSRVLRKLGYNVTTIGTAYRNADDGRRYCVIKSQSPHNSENFVSKVDDFSKSKSAK